MTINSIVTTDTTGSEQQNAFSTNLVGHNKEKKYVMVGMDCLCSRDVSVLSCHVVHVCPYLVRLPKEWISSTALVNDVSDEVFLSIVGGKNTDAVRGVAQETHVHKEGHAVLRLSQILHSGIKKRRYQYYCII